MSVLSFTFYFILLLSEGWREVGRVPPEECPDSVYGVLLATKKPR